MHDNYFFNVNNIYNEMKYSKKNEEEICCDQSQQFRFCKKFPDCDIFIHNQINYWTECNMSEMWKFQMKIMIHQYFCLKLFHKMLYILTIVWVLGTPNAGRNGHFQRFLCKKPKNSKNSAGNFSKKQGVFYF